ncbi:MAG: hypothetical protein AAF515_18580 [Pseudomonadota bacterium]
MKTNQGHPRSRFHWLLSSVLLLVGTNAGANLVPSPSFENANDWDVDTNHQIVNSDARSGSKALRLTSTGESKSYTTWSKKISATQGEEFRLNVFVKARNLQAGPGLTPLAMMRFRDGGGFVLNHAGKRTEGYRWPPYPNGANGTYGYTDSNMAIRFQMTDKGDAFEVGFRTWFDNTAGLTFFDDVEVVKVDFPRRGGLVQTLQAENANPIVKGVVSSTENEYTGTGYVDVTGNNAELTWKNVQSSGGNRIFSVRYSREGFDRPMTLFINGQQVGSATALPTGRRGVYATYDFEANVPAGNNTIKLVVGKGGGPLGQPLIDKITVFALSGSNPPPPPPPPPGGEPPAAPASISASDGQFTDRVQVDWSASNGATRYELHRRNGSGTGSLVADTASTSYADNNATPLTAYEYRARACNDDGCSGYTAWEAGSRGDSGGGGNPGGMGSLSGTIAPSSANANLSVNTADWIKPGATTVRKANMMQISAISGLGGTEGLSYTSARYGHSWQGGSPNATGNNSKTGIRVFNDNRGLQFSAPASTTNRTLKIWLTGRGKGSSPFSATISAELSDGSASVYSTTLDEPGTKKFGRLITLSYASDGGNENLVVSVMKNGGAFVAIDAITLEGGDDVNQPPSLSVPAMVTIVEGDPLHIDLSADDPEGGAVTFSYSPSNALPGNAPSLTDAGSGVAAFDWQSQLGDAGEYTVSFTAMDEDMMATTRSVTIKVTPVGGAEGSLSASATEVTETFIDLSGSFIKYAPTKTVEEATNAAGAQPFSSIMRLGQALGPRSSKSRARYSWTGVPTNGNRVRGGVRVFDPMPVGLAVEIDADASQNSARVYIGVQDVVARAVVSLSDGSAPSQTVDIDRRGGTIQTYALDIDYSAAGSAKVVVQLYVLEETDDDLIGWVQFEAAQQ